MSPAIAQNLNKALIFSKVEETRKYDECMYLLAIQILKKEGTINSRMIREQLHLEYEPSLKLMERIRIDHILEQDNR